MNINFLRCVGLNKMEEIKLKKFRSEDWCSCPICGNDCLIYTKGKNKGLSSCSECDIKWKRPKIINGSS